MYQIRDDFCGFVPNWAFVESVAEIRFADLPTLGDLRRMTALPVLQVQRKQQEESRLSPRLRDDWGAAVKADLGHALLACVSLIVTRLRNVHVE